VPILANEHSPLDLLPKNGDQLPTSCPPCFQNPDVIYHLTARGDSGKAIIETDDVRRMTSLAQNGSFSPSNAVLAL
jgi:hypothetical protein